MIMCCLGKINLNTENIFFVQPQVKPYEFKTIVMVEMENKLSALAYGAVVD